MRFIDLFSGIGGFRLGIESENDNCVYSADFDKSACESYKLNYNEYPYQDITKVDAHSLPDHDLLCAGFPCQPFSIAGHRKGFSESRGTLFFDIERILSAKNPDVFILENVKGLTNHDSGKTFSHIINVLAESVNGQTNLSKIENNLSYNVYWKVINASDFGLPQNRERIFIVGFKNNKARFTFPEYSGTHKSLLDILDDKPVIKQISSLSKTYIREYLKKHKKYNEIKDYKYLIAYEIRKSRVSFRYDNKSPCLTTKMGTGGNNVPYLVNYDRFLTLKECLKIQGFPCDFKLTGSYNESLKQIGNSVAVPVIREIYKEVKKCLNAI